MLVEQSLPSNKQSFYAKRKMNKKIQTGAMMMRRIKRRRKRRGNTGRRL